jgi:hypothetical protein
MVSLIRELRYFPVNNEVKLKHRSDPTFPDAKTFQAFAPKQQLVAKVLAYCKSH